MNEIEVDQTIAALRRENHLLHRIIERARSYRGNDGRACPLCSFENSVFMTRCEPHAQIHRVLEQMADAYRLICAGDIDGARSLLDAATRLHRWSESHKSSG